MIIAACVYLIEFLDRYYNMQEELIANEKANIVSHMAASVAHEIRNPLTTVKGFIQLFGKGQLDEERRNYYQRMCLEELDRAQQIISDYLALAKPEPETMERLNINEEIRYFSDVLHTYADLNNVQITYFPCDRQPVILGDKNYLRQSLINIGKNAIEAMSNGGILHIKATAMKDSVVIIISDTGVGMTTEQIKRLGSPYFSTKEKGTGLGMTVSINIIKKMKGKIEIKSEIGKGTEFSIKFPSA